MLSVLRLRCCVQQRGSDQVRLCAVTALRAVATSPGVGQALLQQIGVAQAK
jgi:hypothetical protein